MQKIKLQILQGFFRILDIVEYLYKKIRHSPQKGKHDCFLIKSHYLFPILILGSKLRSYFLKTSQMIKKNGEKNFCQKFFPQNGFQKKGFGGFSGFKILMSEALKNWFFSPLFSPLILLLQCSEGSICLNSS